MRQAFTRRRSLQTDDGFSLLETIIALTIAAVAFSTLAVALVGGAHTSLLSQQNQQAGDLLSQTVEQTRALGYDALAMRAGDLDTGEPTRTPTLSSCTCYSPNTGLTSGSGVEPLAPRDPAGRVWPHVGTAIQNRLTYTVRRYVTAPVDTAGAYKRLSVIVSWRSLGKTRTRFFSTVITASKRGLPLPDYKFTATGGGLTQCRNPGSSAVYAFVLKNNGARDAWSLTTTGSGSWMFFADTNASGSYDAGDQSMVVAGTATTGLLEPTNQVTFFAVGNLPAATSVPPPYTWSTVFRATSAAQSSYFSELTATTTVQSTPCGGVVVIPTSTPSPTPSPTVTPTATPVAPTQPAASCTSISTVPSASAPSGTVVRYYFGNPSYPGNTNASQNMPVTRDSGTGPSGTSLYAYSQDLTAAAGRYLGGGATSSPQDLASWDYQMPAASSLKGSGAVTFYATTASGLTTQAPSFSVTLQLLNPDGSVSQSQGATYSTPSTGWGCSGFRPFTVQLGDWNGSGTPVAANQKIRILLRVTNAVPVLLAYGTAAYPSELQLPFTSGLG